ncbi:MAG: hypothetical protein A2X56_12375 [Nitrospirae bacterium GWC2_57_13]|nr:MAG: hypothetical protein A2072_01615 [Nitrospirae bacterium GWC1_57_7]OGW26422.1 MAG: hypothetical protein A2X56_12375 [Nitrospirae bacterium GWC2_57_13]OGW46105.1 MAG: hypothetical protein A2X57_03785 [Nitrospirae bacterium GWD2_57_8]HAS55246.1 hypothetical protein [Nitrospiraceae bacterium]
MMKRFAVISVISALLLSACGGRMARPIKAVWPDDATMTCEDLSSERRRNNGEIAMLRAEKARRIKHNVDSLCLFFCIIPLFTLDFNDTQDIEVDAYKERNRRLDDLARQKNCPAVQK